jgi:cyclopropane fatty-acyl-phospholipid synthase-like methyltransferase
MGSDREPEAARYSAMRWNTPLSEAHAGVLIESLAVNGAGSVLDLGCGWAELLIRVLRSSDEGCIGTGVDTDGALLNRAAASITRGGLHERISLQQCSVTQWSQPADRVICIGASHAWGGTVAALQRLSELVKPGGRLLFGDGCWERDPTAEALAIFGQDVLPLGEVVERALDTGWRLLTLSTADQREWDDFEASWRRGTEQWLSANPDHPRAAETRKHLDARLLEYVNDYRRVLGFCYLILTR